MFYFIRYYCVAVDSTCVRELLLAAPCLCQTTFLWELILLNSIIYLHAYRISIQAYNW